MTPEDRVMSRVGKVLDRALGPGPTMNHQEMYKAGVQNTLRSRRERPGSGRTAWSVAIGVTALFVVGFFAHHILTGPEVMRYRVGAANSTAEWIENDTTDAVPVVFENGSRFMVYPAAAARIMDADAHRVRLHLDRGRMDAHINGNGRTRWTVTAGPYTVTVLGTVFSTTYTPDSSRLAVTVTRGRVSVAGPPNRPTVTLEAGQGLVADREGVHIEEAFADAEGEPRIAGNRTSPEPTAVRSSAPATFETHGTAHPARDNPAPSPWSPAVHKQDWSAAVDTLRDGDTTTVIEQVGENALWRLADAARSKRRALLAARLFKGYRLRFAPSHRAQTAAYFLGRIAEDFRGDLPAAKRWYAVYLDEAPEGPLFESSLERLMSAAERLGQLRDARRAATDYLNRYPEGTAHTTAERLLDTHRRAP